LVIFVTIAVFLAMAFGVLAVFWLLESRRESLPQRLKNISEPPPGAESARSEKIGSWFTDVMNRFKSKRPIQDDILAVFTSKQTTGTRIQLIRAGFRNPSSYQKYVVIRIVLPILLFILAVSLGKSAGMANQKIFFLGMLGLFFGFLFPIAFVRWKIGKRQMEITDYLPDALDLLVVCVEAGLGLNASFVKISEEFNLTSPILSNEFDIVNREMVAGKPRIEALRSLSDRTGVEEVKSLVAMLIQTEKLGTSLAQSLRVHSDSLRTKRRQRAEEAAAKTTIKLVFPLVFLLFPALFVVILGPGFIQIANVLFPTLAKGG
jgi:tight adherence protein C